MYTWKRATIQEKKREEKKKVLDYIHKREKGQENQ